MSRGILVFVVALALAGCSAGSTLAGNGSTAVTSQPPPVSVAPPDPNVAVCSKVQDLAAGRIQSTFKLWQRTGEGFNQRVGDELRNEATHLFSLAAQAHGAVATAIQHEAHGLTDISVAIAVYDDAAVGNAANRANSSLAEVRGACGF